MKVKELVSLLAKQQGDDEVQIDFTGKAKAVLRDRLMTGYHQCEEYNNLTCKPTGYCTGQHVITLTVDTDFINY